MEDAVLEQKFIPKMKPLEGEKKRISMEEERTPLSNCKEKYFSFPSAYVDKVKWLKGLISQVVSEVEESIPVEVR